jgi:hypothetical protein
MSSMAATSVRPPVVEIMRTSKVSGKDAWHDAPEADESDREVAFADVPQRGQALVQL